MNEPKKPSARGVISGSLLIVVLLAMKRKSNNDIIETIGFLATVFITYFIIQMLLKYIKDYVDFAMKQKRNDENQHNHSLGKDNDV
jgi:hypothetical protein